MPPWALVLVINDISIKHVHLYFLRRSSSYEISLDIINPFGGATWKLNELHRMARDACKACLSQDCMPSHVEKFNFSAS